MASWQQLNKNKVNSYHRNYYKDNPDAHKNRVLKYKFGITLNDFNNLSNAQQHMCAICGEKDINNRRLAVDHDHKTGRIRGLLCGRCNRLVGRLEVPNGQAAVKYLQERG